MQEYTNDEVLIKDILQTVIEDMCEARDIPEEQIPRILHELALDIENEQRLTIKLTNIPEDDY